MTENHDVSDRELIRRVAEGSGPAFSQLISRFTPMLYAVAYRMYPQKQDAEEIVQEALLKIWNKAALYDESKGAAVSTWIYRLAYNLCIDFKRKEKAVHMELKDVHQSPDKGADDQMDDSMKEDMVHKAVENLPERQRAALVLCHFEGLSNAEAADIMDTTVKAVEGLLVRARKALMEDLKQHKDILVAS